MSPPPVYLFGDFRLDARRRLLLSAAGGQAPPLTAKAFDTLLHLVEHAGEVVDKAALMRAVWPHVSVEENSLNQAISAVRRALGEDPAAHRFIVTAPGRGYRFIADVSVDDVVPGAGRDRSVAVLPFKPMDACEAHESLELGMADALIMRLAGLADIRLSPLSSVRRYGGVEQDPIEAGRALGVSVVLDGLIQRRGDRLRLTVRLLDVGDGRQLWADRFDESFTDIFGIQDVIAERVAEAVLEAVTGRERRRLRRHATDDPQAYQLYVSGWSALTRPGGGNLEQAVLSLEQAVLRDPGFALAHVCVADGYALLGVFGLRAPHDVFPQARAAVLKALEIDPGLAEAHAELGHIYGVYDLDGPAAARALRRALEIDPRSAMAHHYLGLWAVGRGTLEEAMDSVRRAQALEPLAANFNANIGMIHYYAGRYEQAVAQLEATLELDGGFDHARSFLGRSFLRLGRFDAAIEQFQRRTTCTLGGAADLPIAYALSGRAPEAYQELERLLRSASARYVPPYDVAAIYAALGRSDTALDWLEHAIEQRVQPINYVHLDPVFANLRGRPRFRAILERLA